MGTPVKHEDLHELAMTYAIKNEMTHEELIKELMFNAVAVSIYVLQLNKLDTDILEINTHVFEAKITFKEPANEIFEQVINYAKHE